LAGVGDFEHLWWRSCSASSASSRSVETIGFVDRANAKIAGESGLPDQGKNFPNRLI
jgi:hypothetical protein